MLTQRIRLVIGLGNPGAAYRNTRHNAGFLVLNRLAQAFSIPLDKSKFDAVLGRGKIGNHEIILALPQAFMNRSGPPVLRVINYFKILIEEILVVHDDIDLPVGRIKIKVNGGHGGHNGLKSLIDSLGDKNFVRLRVGIGRSEVSTVANHVLGRFNDLEFRGLEQTLQHACDAVIMIIEKGLRESMNLFNQKEFPMSL